MDIRSERSQGGESKLAFSCASAGGMSVVGVAAVVALIPLAFAQDPPSATEKRRFDSGALQQAQRRANEASQVPGKPVRTVIRTDMPKMLTFVASLKLSVKGFRLEGVADIPSHEIEAVLGQWKGRELSFAEFEKAVHAVARYLRENGHPNAQVKVSQAQVADGMLAIAVQGLSKPQQVAEAVAPPVLPQEVSPRILIKSFRFSGATTTSNEELQKSVSQWANKLLTVDELKQTAEGVAAYLRNKGYTLAQAWLPPQRVDTGELEIAIQEGVVDPQSGTGGLTITGAGKRIAPQVIESILSSSIHPGEPFMSSNLEGALMIANELPGVKSVRANLSPGTSPGTTQIEAQVEETELLTG